jgi:Subtilase family
VTHYFQPVEGTGPAAPFLSPEELAKPDVTATDCGRTTFFASHTGSIWRFCGTSAAAPHAAAVAALLRQGDANATAPQIRESLLETATSIGTPPFPPTAVGAGLVDAFSAVEKLPEFTAEEDGPSTVVPPLEVPVDRSTPSSPPPPTATTPNTFFAKHPTKTVRIHGSKVKLVFRFRSDQSGVTFLCKIDKARFRACGAKLAHTFKPGPHVVKAKARNAAGLVDSTPAVFRFRVDRVR